MDAAADSAVSFTAANESSELNELSTNTGLDNERSQKPFIPARDRTMVDGADYWRNGRFRIWFYPVPVAIAR